MRCAVLDATGVVRVRLAEFQTWCTRLCFDRVPWTERDITLAQQTTVVFFFFISILPSLTTTYLFLSLPFYACKRPVAGCPRRSPKCAWLMHGGRCSLVLLDVPLCLPVAWPLWPSPRTAMLLQSQWLPPPALLPPPPSASPPRLNPPWTSSRVSLASSPPSRKPLVSALLNWNEHKRHPPFRTLISRQRRKPEYDSNYYFISCGPLAVYLSPP